MKYLWGIAIAALVAGCGQTKTPAAPTTTLTPDDAFISQIETNPYWKGTDRAKAIAAGHAFCDTIANSNQFDNGGEADMRTVLNNRYGFGPAMTFTTAAEQNYCPGTSRY